jgi:hypothetical protein
MISVFWKTRGDAMPAFETATNFFHACESLQGWEGCKQYVALGARFSAQSEPLVEIDTVEGYANWMAGFGNGVVPGCGYTLHSSSYDEATRTAIFFATFTGTHTGDGGPVSPTNKQTNSEYVYALTLNDDNLISSMVKVWNAPWAINELGWS